MKTPKFTIADDETLAGLTLRVNLEHGWYHISMEQVVGAPSGSFDPWVRFVSDHPVEYILFPL